jgi:hypothetical protein
MGSDENKAVNNNVFFYIGKHTIVYQGWYPMHCRHLQWLQGFASCLRQHRAITHENQASNYTQINGDLGNVPGVPTKSDMSAPGT